MLLTFFYILPTNIIYMYFCHFSSFEDLIGMTSSRPVNGVIK